MKFRVSLNIARKIYTMAINVPTVKLSNGLNFPVIGLGTYKVIFNLN